MRAVIWFSLFTEGIEGKVGSLWKTGRQGTRKKGVVQ